MQEIVPKIIFDQFAIPSITCISFWRKEKEKSH